MQQVRCRQKTLYLAGFQIRTGDVISARVDGVKVAPEDLPSYDRRGVVELRTRFGDTTVELDPERLHGRRARSLTGTDPVLAALALANLAGHPERRASLTHARRVAARSLRQVDDATLLRLLEDQPDAAAVFAGLAGGHVALRVWRNPGLAERFAVACDATLLGQAVTHERVTVTADAGHPAARFEAALRAGARPQARGFAQKSALAAASPDAAQRLLHDSHPLVRAAAQRHARPDQLADTLRTDPDPVVRRAAAVAVAARLGRPLVEEGTISERPVSTSRPAVVFVDVDGTLLDGPTHIDASSLEVLRRVQHEGVHVVAVTGRSVDTFAPLGLGVDLAVCDGKIIDMVTMTELGAVDDKGEAVDTLCTLLGVQHCAAAGDGAIDVPMFEAVRRRGGRCAWPANGQDAAAGYATDIVGPVGSGGVGRFVASAVEGHNLGGVPPVAPDTRPRTNYPSQRLTKAQLRQLADDHAMVPDPSWQLAHGHVTLAYPSAGETPEAMPAPRPGAVVEVYGLVRTPECTAFAVRVDGETTQPNGKPLHITVALAPTSDGHQAPVIAGPAVARALQDGSLEPIHPPLRVSTLASPVGTPKEELPTGIAATASEVAHHDASTYYRSVAGIGADRTADHASEPHPVEAALQSGVALRRGLVILSGIPASGKSTRAEQLLSEGAVVVNLDSIRAELNDDESSQARLADVVALANARIVTELSLGRLVVSDATNVEEKVLRPLVDAAHAAGAPAVIARTSVSRDEAIERDHARHLAGKRAVGTRDGIWVRSEAEKIIDRMLARASSVEPLLAAPHRLGADAVIDASELVTSP